ncbi:hypothetical protein CMV_018603 [Castanea mollissima]|uniref:Uncharacterized protein n=1 Tax=Castanea mollissima TaxID=60419 RepID=A0A8J4QR34_9ROSI|nr:hypothetical protein CMV_018603 [Castanea mollissima]
MKFQPSIQRPVRSCYFVGSDLSNPFKLFALHLRSTVSGSSSRLFHKLPKTAQVEWLCRWRASNLAVTYLFLNEAFSPLSVKEEFKRI